MSAPHIPSVRRRPAPSSIARSAVQISVLRHSEHCQTMPEIVGKLRGRSRKSDATARGRDRNDDRALRQRRQPCSAALTPIKYELILIQVAVRAAYPIFTATQPTVRHALGKSSTMPRRCSKRLSMTWVKPLLVPGCRSGGSAADTTGRVVPTSRAIDDIPTSLDLHARPRVFPDRL